jgi:hypothetical protein
MTMAKLTLAVLLASVIFNLGAALVVSLTFALVIAAAFCKLKGV